MIFPSLSVSSSLCLWGPQSSSPQQAVSMLEILLAFPALGTRSLTAEVSLKLAMGKLPNLWMTDAWHTRDGPF